MRALPPVSDVEQLAPDHQGPEASSPGTPVFGTLPRQAEAKLLHGGWNLDVAAVVLVEEAANRVVGISDEAIQGHRRRRNDLAHKNSPLDASPNEIDLTRHEDSSARQRSILT
jgi:hypothetical protein